MMPHMIFHGLSHASVTRSPLLTRYALSLSLLGASLCGCVAGPQGQHFEAIPIRNPATQQRLPAPQTYQLQQPQSSQEQATCGSTSNFQADMLNRVNRIRAAGAVCGAVRYPPAQPLRWSNQLQQAAAVHARDMAEHNFFNHKSATNGTTLVERLRSVGYKFQAAGENIGAGPATVAQAVDMWVASPGHCVTLMTTGFVDLGASCKNNSNSYYKNYWTLKAATPS